MDLDEKGNEGSNCSENAGGNDPSLCASSAYAIALFIEQPVELNHQTLLDSLKHRFPGLKVLTANTTTIQVVHPPETPGIEKALPPGGVVSVGEWPPNQDEISKSLEQTWNWNEARDKVGLANAQLIVTDLMASQIERSLRLRLFHNLVALTLEKVSCVAIHWRPGQCVVQPGQYLQALHDHPGEVLVGGTINVRMFNVAEGCDETVMDTMGLASFGLPDLQCHFSDLDPTLVARKLYNFAHYIFQNGDVFNDGDTVDGVEPGELWKGRHESALLPPERTVVDIEPGSYAAGNRK